MDNAKACLEAVKNERPGLILLDYDMSPMRGDECCKILKETPELSSIPVVMMTGDRAPGEVMRSWRAAADDFLTKPIRPAHLQAKLRAIMGPAPTEAPTMATTRRQSQRLLFLEDDRFFRYVLGSGLEQSGFHLLYARDLDEAQTLIDAHGASIDAFLFDLVLPKGNSLEVARKLKQDGRFENKPMFILSSSPGESPMTKEAEALTGAPVVDKATLPVDVMISKVNTALRRVAVDLRAGQRVPFFSVVPFRVETSDEWILGFSYDVSVGGLFVKTANPGPMGSSVELLVNFGGKEPTVAKAHVAWSNPFRRRLTFSYPVGMGLQFSHLEPKEREALVQLVKAKPSEVQAAARMEKRG
jgi:uncharacterized protein (TIGR02266 family)